ncbi:TerB family tellurite resistance protein [Phormidium yuhuli AB48]|uniref:TerB family tellurite resistance protein n=1 Tax=Phormidium yuhuli AB48 TaxID=2940671 RepID=A0ABY5AJD6_9CYAN|nr:TerB family tellurite resistance protein [Phormidium yuhuli]USR89322.1 TerB family tellurite resistance protein [Phormidium yuhuli AB48]
MPIQPPAPPPISPRQMNLLRIVAAMAWADGELAQEEVEVMLSRFSELFAKSPEQRQKLREDLQAYCIQNIPLEDLVPKLQSDDERELVLRLGYEVIASSSRTPDEPKINEEEATAYQKLRELLGLPEAKVKEIEAKEFSFDSDDPSLVESLGESLQDFFQD